MRPNSIAPNSEQSEFADEKAPDRCTVPGHLGARSHRKIACAGPVPSSENALRAAPLSSSKRRGERANGARSRAEALALALVGGAREDAIKLVRDGMITVVCGDVLTVLGRLCCA